MYKTHPFSWCKIVPLLDVLRHDVQSQYWSVSILSVTLELARVGGVGWRKNAWPWVLKIFVHVICLTFQHSNTGVGPWWLLAAPGLDPPTPLPGCPSPVISTTAAPRPQSAIRSFFSSARRLLHSKPFSDEGGVGRKARWRRHALRRSNNRHDACMKHHLFVNSFRFSGKGASCVTSQHSGVSTDVTPDVISTNLLCRHFVTDASSVNLTHTHTHVHAHTHTHTHTHTHRDTPALRRSQSDTDMAGRRK